MHSSTLPRSTPNLLEGSGLSGLSLPAQDSPTTSSHQASPLYTKKSSLHQSPNTTSTSTSSPFRTSSPFQVNGKNAPSTANTSTDSILDSSTSSSNNNNNNSVNKNNNNNKGGGGKKVPPKPPPKPAGKRLSTSSIPGDVKKDCHYPLLTLVATLPGRGKTEGSAGQHSNTTHPPLRTEYIFGKPFVVPGFVEAEVGYLHIGVVTSCAFS
ncbi:hypothetical protein E2C01_033398 [Portunus trituberculatus]|uniref:Uncharacterized protein n=1 Tax=Portunus trituberculatus TaxID=210409 RepID=A0A5B7F3Y8_PORTR|nr:hypothetical protein [Portunus trituberculatus]